MLKIENISVIYRKKQALDSLTLELQTGQAHGIVGLNGAGKTSLFNVVSGSLKPASGQVLLNKTPLPIQKIAYLEADNHFFPMLTAQEYLNVFKQTNPNYKEQALLELFRLPPNQLIEEYSTGMKKRLAMLSILKQEKELYIFDEPFNGIDLDGVLLFEQIIAELKHRRKTLLVSSHIMAPLEKIADTISYLSRGSICETFYPADFEKLHQILDKETNGFVENRGLF